MALREILTDGDPVLNKVCHPVEKFDGRLHAVLDDMKETLIDSNGVGLAAPQIGILRRVVLVINEKDEILELINPTIIHTEGEQTDMEGCLSLPGLYGLVTRPMKATVRAQNRFGEWYEAKGEGITARCFCHELEHLDGHLFKERVEGKLYTIEELQDMMEDEESDE